MAMSAYAKDYYASLVVGLETVPPPMYLTLCTVEPTSSDTGSTIAEAPTPRVLLVPGVGHWTTPVSGVTDYEHAFEYVLTEDDYWGTVVGYAICDTLTQGTGNILFYGTLAPFTIDYSSVMLSISGISILVGEQ